MKLTARLLAAACACSFLTTARAGEEITPKETPPPAPLDDRWRFSLAAPGWLAATAGTIGDDGFNSDVYLGADSLISHLDMVASLSAEARKGRFGIYGDMLYISASDGVGTGGLIKKLDIRLDEYITDMELSYRVLECERGWLDVRAGVRYTNIYSRLSTTPDDEAIDRASERFIENVSADLRNVLRDAAGDVLDGKNSTLPIPPLGAGQKAKLLALILAAKRDPELVAAIKAEAAATTAALKATAQTRIDSAKDRLKKKLAKDLKKNLDNTFSLAEDWWDPYIGLNARYDFSKVFYLTAKADIGGFGVGSALTWQASGALGCNLTRSIFVEAGYRYLYTDYHKNDFEYDVSQSGVQFTTGVTF